MHGSFAEFAHDSHSRGIDLTPSGPVAIDLFSGVGGMSLGFDNAGFSVAGAFELESRHVDTYNMNFAHKAFQADLASSTSKSLRELASLPRHIDVIFGGPPCQGFSFGGRKDPRDPRNKLLLHFLRLVIDIKPRVFVMENVQGLNTSIGYAKLSKFISIAKAAGYNIRFPIRVLDASDFGVPQRRKRVIVIGARRGCRLPDYPAPHPIRYTCKDAIGDLPLFGKVGSQYSDDQYIGLIGNPSKYAAALRCHPYAKSASLTGCLVSKHSPRIVTRFRNTPPGMQEPISRFFRLHANSPAPTIRAGTNEDFGGHTAPRPIHYIEPRCITVREAARLHGYPDRFVFHGTRWHGFRQIGNSVPPPFAEAVATAVLNAL